MAHTIPIAFVPPNPVPIGIIAMPTMEITTARS